MREEEQSRLRRRNAELENLVQTLQAKLIKCNDATLPKALAPCLLNGQQTHESELLLSDLHSDLHLSQARYEAIVADHPDPICRFLPDGTLIYVNEACCRYFDRPRSTLLGDNFGDLVAQTAQPSVLSNGSAKGDEHRKLAADGKIAEQPWTSRAIRDLQGCVVEFQAIGRNMTDFRESDLRSDAGSSLTQITRLEGCCRSVIAALHEGVIVLNAEGMIQTCNASAERILERSSTELVSYHRNFTQTGAIVCCEWYNSALFDESGELISILSLVQNITQRTQTEEELRESEERFRQLAENIQQIFWMYAVEDQKLIYISPACEQVLGYDSEECYDKSIDFWLSRIHADLHLVLKTSRQVLRGKPAEVMYRFTKADGSERWLLAKAFPVRNQQGKIYRIAGIAEDITDRKQQEQRLRLLESVIVNANDAIIITEAEPVELPGPKIIYVNEAFTRMMGYEQDEVVGKTPRILQGEKTDWDILQQIRTALKKWEPSLVELVNYHKDGSEVWIELSMFPVTDQSGQYTYWVGLQRDITQRKKTEEALQRQNLRSQLFADVTLKIRQSLHLEEILQTTVTEVRNLLQTDRVLINCLAPDGTGTVTHEAVSPGWNSLIGGTYLTDVVLPGHPKTDYRNVVQAVADIEQEDSPTSDFLRSIKVRARLVVPIVQQNCLWGLLVAHQGSPRQWSSFEIELLQQLAHQVEIALTQSQLLQALRESEERFRTMANSAPVLLWMIDSTGTCVFCNESLLKFTGHRIDPEGSLSWHETVHPADRPYCEATYREALTHHSSFEIEYRLRRADGEYRWVLDRGVPRLMPDGSFGGHIGSCIDITERMRVEDERKQAEIEIRKALEKERELSELKSRFVSTASHEFRTPLSTILSSADLLEFYAGDWTAEKQIEHIQRIQSAALNMNNLLNDILVIERAEAKKLNFEPAQIDLLTFCRSLIDEMQLNDQGNHPLILEVQNWIKPQTAHMDRKLLRQIFSNLLSNAIKYSPSGSTIVCRLTGEANRAIFEVQDQGIGIPSEDQVRLFEPFHRGTNVGTTSGNGLGLAIVKQSIEAHQGQISVHSQEGVGTTVRVILPLQAVEVSKNAHPPI
ncbi:PAS domain S-box protein [Phormidesmis priestleyi]